MYAVSESMSCTIIHFAVMATNGAQNLQIAPSYTRFQLAKQITAAVFDTYRCHGGQLDCNTWSVSHTDNSVIALRECFLFNLALTST